ncbi:hypothetical protein GA0115246_105458, partial [Streptomyces sp. SolWspMP-sol7th]
MRTAARAAYGHRPHARSTRTTPTAAPLTTRPAARPDRTIAAYAARPARTV